MIDASTTQNAFRIIEQLAALCATPGISEKAKEVSNEQIESILTKIVKPAVTELTAKTAGIIQR